MNPSIERKNDNQNQRNEIEKLSSQMATLVGKVQCLQLLSKGSNGSKDHQLDDSFGAAHRRRAYSYEFDSNWNDIVKDLVFPKFHESYIPNVQGLSICDKDVPIFDPDVEQDYNQDVAIFDDDSEALAYEEVDNCEYEEEVGVYDFEGVLIFDHYGDEDDTLVESKGVLEDEASFALTLLSMKDLVAISPIPFLDFKKIMSQLDDKFFLEGKSDVVRTSMVVMFSTIKVRVRWVFIL
ncbi:hypothetical protein ACSBR1_033990 [Camellia fascicularis]